MIHQIYFPHRGENLVASRYSQYSVSDPEIKRLKKNRTNPGRKVKCACRAGKIKEKYEGLVNENKVDLSYYDALPVVDIGQYEYILSESETKDLYETQDPETRKMWSQYVHYFLTNSDKRSFGHGKFPYHFAVYVYFGNKLKPNVKFNPTPVTFSMMHTWHSDVNHST